MRRRSPKSRWPLILGMSSIQASRDPGGDGKQAVVRMAPANPLGAEPQTPAASAGRNGNTRRAGQRPNRVEARIAGGGEALGRLARCTGAEQHADLLEQRIDVRLEGGSLALRGNVALEADGKALLHRSIH